MRQWRLLAIRAIGLQAITYRAAISRHIRKSKGASIHVQLGKNLLLDVILIGHSGCFCHDATQESKSIIGVFVARCRRRREWNALSEPVVQSRVSNTQLLVTPGIV